MPKRKVAQCVIVQRDGKRLKVMPGETFDFTAEELEDIKRTNKDALFQPTENVQEREVKLPGTSSKNSTKQQDEL